MKNIVLIGSGRRAQDVILPALWSARDEFRIEAILSRTPKTLRLFDGAFQMETKTDYASVDWLNVDLVIIAVTLESVPSVVKQLLKSTSDRLQATSRISLMMDTPVVPIKQLGTLKLLKRFKQIQVSEDTMGLPPFIAARAMIDDGLIGNVKHIWLFHSGYRYHALATLKWLTRSSYVRYARYKRWSRSAGVKEVKLSSGATATIVEPRDYTIGRFLIVGEKGSIGDYPIEKAENHHIVTTDEMTSMKRQGFVELMKTLDDPNTPYRYGPIDGVYDALVIAMLEKTGYFFDCGLFGYSWVKRGLQAL